MSIHKCVQCGQLYERFDYSLFWSFCDKCRSVEGFKRGNWDWNSAGAILESIKEFRVERRKSRLV